MACLYASILPTHNKIVPEKIYGTIFLTIALSIRPPASQFCLPRVFSYCHRYGGICFHVISNPLSVYGNKKQTDLRAVTSNCHVLWLLWLEQFCIWETCHAQKTQKKLLFFSKEEKLSSSASSLLCFHVLQCFTSRLASVKKDNINLYFKAGQRCHLTGQSKNRIE